jgi:outer membrane lipoprotein-sorting protein
MSRLSVSIHRSVRKRSIPSGIKTFFLLALSSLFASGCVQHHENLPTYRWTDDAAALRILQDRARAVKTVSAASLLTLTRPDGQSVRLDAALVMSLPDHSVRLRAWKFNQAVFDLTLNRQGLWIEAPKDKQHREQMSPAGISAAQLARALSLFGGTVFQEPGVRVIDGNGPTFQVQKRLDDGQTLTAQVDRATLTVRQYQMADVSGATRFSLTPGDYRNFNGIVWPTHLIARSEHGRIEAELRDVELNGALPPAAFVPPRRAEKAS